MNYIEKGKATYDPTSISFIPPNQIEYHGQRIFFPFGCEDLFLTITKLREKLLDKNVGAVDLQEYPARIFERNEFTGNYELAGYIYNIIYDWTATIDTEIHKNCKSKLFADFLTLCKERVLTFQVNNEDQANDLIPQGISDLRNNIDSVPIQYVYIHFKKGLVDKGHLSEEDLFSYLQYAFEKKQVPNKMFTLKDVQSKQKIKTLFGDYYRNLASKPWGKQRTYAALLGDYFDGYTTENVSTNFS